MAITINMTTIAIQLKSIAMNVLDGFQDFLCGLPILCKIQTSEIERFEKSERERRKEEEMLRRLGKGRQIALNYNSEAAREKCLVFRNYLYNCSWNAGTLIVIKVLFDWLVYCLCQYTPLGQYEGINVVWTIGAIAIDIFWVLPMYLFAQLTNSVFYNQVSNAAFRHSGRTRPQQSRRVTERISEGVFSMILQFLFLLQTALIGFIPLPGVLMYIPVAVSFMCSCMLNSLYAYEYKWTLMGFRLRKQLLIIESNWPYHVAFGLPMTLATRFIHTHPFIRIGIFYVIFPVYIASAINAKPVSRNTIRLPVFEPVIFAGNKLMSVIFIWVMKREAKKEKQSDEKPLRHAEAIVDNVQRR